MSRSCKHVPCCHMVCRNKGMKRLFNKRVRRMGIKEVPSYGAYKKVNETWYDDWRAVGWSMERHRGFHAFFGTELDGEELACGYQSVYISFRRIPLVEKPGQASPPNGRDNP